MKTKAIIHDGNGNFLGFDRQRWVPGMDGDVYEDTYHSALSVARKLKRHCFVSVHYGYVNQKDMPVSEDGSLGDAQYPNSEG